MNPDGLAPKEHEALRGDEMPGGRSAVEAGWRESRYNVRATVPGTHKTMVANLFKGTCAAYTPIELEVEAAIRRSYDSVQPPEGETA